MFKTVLGSQEIARTQEDKDIKLNFKEVEETEPIEAYQVSDYLEG